MVSPIMQMDATGKDSKEKTTFVLSTNNSLLKSCKFIGSYTLSLASMTHWQPSNPLLFFMVPDTAFEQAVRFEQPKIQSKKRQGRMIFMARKGLKKKGKLLLSHRYNLLPLLRSRPGGLRGSWS